MVKEILNVLAQSTPALRARYLARVRAVPGPEARRLESELLALTQRDTARAA
jgi:hypothetical protein